MDFLYFLGSFPRSRAPPADRHHRRGVRSRVARAARRGTTISRQRRRSSGARLALSALVTVLLGYLHFAEGSFIGSSADQHRFFGTAVAVVAIGGRVAAHRAASPTTTSRCSSRPRSLLLVLVSITGHYGGNLTHGDTYLVEYAPQPMRSLAGLAPRRTLTSVSAADPFADVVGPMLAERCASCHNDDKQESDLVLTTYAGSHARRRERQGGRRRQHGARASCCAAFRVPHDDEEFMPAEGKTPLTARASRDHPLVDRRRRAERRHDRHARGSRRNARTLLTEELGVSF